MRNTARWTCAAIAAIGLAACNGRDPSQPRPPTPQAGEATPAAPRGQGLEAQDARPGVVPQAQLDALQKARNVEGVLQQGAQRSEPGAQ